MEKILPKNWVETELMNLCEVYTGKKDANFATENGEYNFFTCAYKPLKSDSYSFEGDVLILPGNGVNVGEVFYFSGKFEAYQRTYIVNDIKIDPKYLFYHFSRFWREIGSLKQFGSATNYIKIGNFKDYKVQFPPLKEQQRIVAKLDGIFTHLESLKTRLNNIPTLLKHFRQAILTQAVTGKLTQDWRKGRELEIFSFENIEKERQKNKSKKVRDNVMNLRNDLELFDIPQLWRWCNLGFVLSDEYAFRYGVVQPGEDVDGQQKLIRVKDIKNDEIDFENLRGISHKVDSKYKSAQVKKGDLLVSIVGTIGRTVIVTEKCTGFNIARAIAKLPIDKCNSKFIKIFIDSENGQRWLNGDSREVARKTLNLNQLKTLPIPIPSKEEQTEIVKRVENLFVKADKIEAQYVHLKEKIDSLPQAILAKAFKGELVPQLPTDGDAKDLLAEIQKLKEASLESKKKIVKKKK